MITAEIAGERPGIRCDRDQVLRVFGNLIGNALKFITVDGAPDKGSTFSFTRPVA
jgi:signal transduction histidine kinase